jgi:hypothetical protein
MEKLTAARNLKGESTPPPSVMFWGTPLIGFSFSPLPHPRSSNAPLALVPHERHVEHRSGAGAATQILSRCVV